MASTRAGLVRSLSPTWTSSQLMTSNKVRWVSGTEADESQSMVQRTDWTKNRRKIMEGRGRKKIQ